MVTGDNPVTAQAIAREAGILQGGTVMTGKEFRVLSAGEQVAAAKNLDVMARAEPLDKLLLVQALQKTGAVVAVTGDGTNDAPRSGTRTWDLQWVSPVPKWHGRQATSSFSTTPLPR